MRTDPPIEKAAAEWLRRNTLLIALAFSFTFLVLPHISPWDGLNDNLAIFQRFNRWLFGKVEQLFDEYGYPVVFISVLLENSMFLGLFVPGALILLLAGLSAENGNIGLGWVLLLGIAATWLGDTISYVIGRTGWSRALQNTGLGSSIDRVRERMESHTVWIILVYHFAGYSRMVGPMAAGLFRIPFRRWAPLDYTGGVLWVFAFTGIGYALGLAGVEFSDTKTIAQIVEWGIFAVLVIAVIAVYARSNDGSPPARGPRTDTVVIPVDEQ